jgi:hypothetical protein
LLTRRHLAVLRAALQFFDEEIMPHGVRVMRPYFDEPLHRKLKPGELQKLRTFLRGCELKYACYDPASGRLTSPKLSPPAEKTRLKTGDPASQIAVVLLPPG